MLVRDEGEGTGWFWRLSSVLFFFVCVGVGGDEGAARAHVAECACALTEYYAGTGRTVLVGGCDSPGQRVIPHWGGDSYRCLR